MPEITRESMIRLAGDFPKGSEGRKALLARIEASTKTARPVSIRDAEVMLYMIEPRNNNSKFYEMRVVRFGQETTPPRTKPKYWSDDPQYVLERRWGRLTDTGESGRVDAINDFVADQRTAEGMMRKITYEKTHKGYQDVSRKREYPIGLGSAGFGWGGQEVCQVIPELQALLGHVTEAQALLSPLARVDNAVAKKLEFWLDPMRKYLLEQLAHCR